MATAGQQTRIDDRVFKKKMRALLNQLEDFSPVFLTIARMFYQSRRSIFRLKSRGQYKDLSTGKDGKGGYKRWKELKYNGRIYPILRAEGTLMRAITNMGGPGNYTRIGKKFFVVGVDDKDIPYAKFHNSRRPRSKMPFRPFVFWGEEAPATMVNMTHETKKLHARAIASLKRFIKRSTKNIGFK